MIGLHETRLALRARLLTVPTLPAVHAWEGVAFERPDGTTAWVRETLLPAAGSSQTVGLPAATGEVWTDLVYQADGFFPGGAGMAAAEAFAADFCRAFRVAFPTGVLAAGAGAVVLQGAATLPARVDGPWIHLPATARCRLQMPNAA